MKWIKAFFYILFIYSAMLATTAMNGGSLHSAFSLSALPFAIAGWVFVFASHSLSEVIQAFGDATGLMDSDQPTQLSQQIMRSMGNYALYSTGAVTLMAVFAALANLDDSKQLGIAIGISLQPLVWALVAKVFILTPLQGKLRQKEV